MERSWHWITGSIILIMLAALLHPASTSVAFAAGIVVNPGGGGNFTTIQAAINNASPGDSILIKTGTYTENLNLSLMGSAIGGTTGNLNLVAVDGPGTAILSGSGVKLTNSGTYNGSLTIDGLRFSSTNEDGIRLTNVNNLVIANSTFDPIGSDFAQHNGLELTLDSGTPNIVLYQNSFSNIANDAVSIVAQSTVQPTVTIVGNTITDNGTNTNTTDQAISLTVLNSAVARATIADNSLGTLESRAVAIGVGNTAQVQASVVRNTINTITTADQAIIAETLNSATTAALDVTIADNTISNISSGLGIFVQMGGVIATPSTPSITARVLRNTLTNIGNNDFDRGIVIAPGISGNPTLNGTINALVENNQLNTIAASGLYILADDSIDIDATVRNNTFTNMVTFPSANEAGFLFRTNSTAVTPDQRLRLALTNNTATTATPGTNREIRLLHQNGTFQLEGNPALTVEQNVATDNPSAAGSILVGGTIGIIARGTVVAPSENGPPVAVDDSATTNSGVPVTINVLANDTDPNSNPRRLNFFTPVSFRGGSVTRNDNGTPSDLTDDQLVYTSPVGYVGSDTFYYTAADTGGFTDVAKVTVNVLAAPTNTPTNTATTTATNTPTSTSAPPTNTPTNTPTSTSVSPTNTPTNTPTSTSVSPTDTPTNTPTSTPVSSTNTPTSTPTDTPAPSTGTPTNTPAVDDPPVTTLSVSGTQSCPGVYDSGATITLNANEPATIQYRINGGAWQTYSGPIVLTTTGTYTIDFFATDLAGNVEATKTQTVEIGTCNPAPNVTINQASGQADPTNVSPIRFTVVFDEPVSGFGDSSTDVTLGGTAGATTSAVTEIAPNDGTTYEVAVSGMTASGTVTAEIPAGAANDTLGAPNTASTSTDNTVTFVISSPTTLLYNGAQTVNAGSAFQPAAKLSSSAAACVNGQTISFSLDSDPLTGVTGSYALGTAVTNASGQATMSAINTTGWLEGIYEITASFAGTSNCNPSSDQATLTVASPGNSATGGGWYTLPGSGRVNFGFNVRKVDNKCKTNCAYQGHLLFMNNGKWKLKGTLDTYVKLSNGKGAASGVGDLYWWDASLNGGLGDWALAQSGVAYTINIYDSGKNGKASTDAFGINIQYIPVPPQPNNLPNSAPTQLKGGDIKVQ